MGAILYLRINLRSGFGTWLRSFPIFRDFRILLPGLGHLTGDHSWPTVWPWRPYRQLSWSFPNFRNFRILLPGLGHLTGDHSWPTVLPAGPTFWPRQPFWRPSRPVSWRPYRPTLPSKTTFWRPYRPMLPSKTTFGRLYRPIFPYKTTFWQPFWPILLVLDDETCMTDPSTHKFNQTPPQSCGGHTLVYIHI